MLGLLLLASSVAESPNPDFVEHKVSQYVLAHHVLATNQFLLDEHRLLHRGFRKAGPQLKNVLLIDRSSTSGIRPIGWTNHGCLEVIPTL